MMRTVGAEKAPDIAAALVLAHLGATGATGLFDLSATNLRKASKRFCCDALWSLLARSGDAASRRLRAGLE